MFAQASFWLAADKGAEALARAMGAVADDTAQTKLALNFSDCGHLSDISSIGGGLENLVNLQELSMNFEDCEQLSDISSIGEALEKLVSLQQLTTSFNCCDQIPVICSIGGGLKKLSMQFCGCAQLSGLEALNGVLEGMSGEGIDTDSNEVNYKHKRIVPDDVAADNACATVVDMVTSDKSRVDT